MSTNVIFILLVFYGPAINLAQYEISVTADSSTESHNNINVIVFLAHADFSMNFEQKDGMDFLNISTVGKIKPCTMRPESDLPRSFAHIIQHKQPKECDCKKLLETSIFSLMGWARNAMEMTTTIVNLIDNEKVAEREKRSQYYDYKLETIDSTVSGENPHPKKEDQYSTYINMQNKDDLNQLPLPNMEDDAFPGFTRDANLVKQVIPIINAFPLEHKLKFNDIHKYDKYGEFVNVRRVKRQLIVEPENTQVFEIESKKEEPREILNIPSLENSGKPQSIWDVLGIMSAIRRSFFVNFLNPRLDPHQRMLEDENGLNVNSLGEMRMPSLFQLVQSSLIRLQEETKANHANGYILIVFGGSLSDLAQAKSDLVQSIKHVQETTSVEHTLLVVTGSCPENHTHHTAQQRMNTKAEFMLPLYAKGPNSGLLSKAKELFDVPVQIKASIETSNPQETNKSPEEKIDLEIKIENTNHSDVNNINEMESMFNKEWNQDINSNDNDKDDNVKNMG